MSSIAASVWQGGNDNTFNADGSLASSTLAFKGIGAGTGAIGTLAFSAIMGGAGSVIGGGNFWQGATTGLIVSGFNHLAHKTNTKTGLSSRRSVEDENGNIISESLNYFDPKKDPDLFARAESEPMRLNELTIYSHGSPDGFAYSYNLNAGNGITDILLADSQMFRDFVGGKTKSLTMVLKACETGKFIPYKSNISHVLTKQYGGLTIFSAGGMWFANGKVGGHIGNTFHSAGYNKYQNGSYIKNVPVK